MVLVVEDNDDLRYIFRDSLKSAGFDVCDASDGPQALRMIDECRPDVVVLDLGLPTLDGMSVREELAAHPLTRHIPVVVVTGDDAAADRIKAARVLRKPVEPDRLIAAVRIALGSNV